MSETPEALRALIEAANAAGPGPERLAAVRTRLEVQLGPLDAAPMPPPPTGAGSTLAFKAGVGLIAAAIALWLGARPPQRTPTAQEVPAPTHVDAPSVAPAHEPAFAPPAPVEVERPIVPAAEEPAPRAARAPTREVVAPSAPVAPSSAPGVEGASSLREEIAVMDRAIRAREAGDVAHARRALEEHRARFPSGTLGLERDRMLSELDDAERPAPTP